MFMSADERWKLRRKLYFQMLQETKCNEDHMRLVEAETAQLIHDIAIQPESIMFHPGRMSNSITMSMVYGIRTPRYDTPHYVKLQAIMTELSSIGEIGATPPVDLLSILKYLPGKLWGNWKTRAVNLRQAIINLHSPLVDEVLQRREKIGKSDTFLDGVFDRQDKLQLTRNEIDIMCGNLLEGGTDTIATTLLSLCQIMATYPDLVAEAQSEIDSVLDEYTLPSWEHYKKLPMVSMIVKEIIRWRPPAPSAFPHALASDDEIDGMKIPKGSTVVLNIWGMHHDPARYPNPENFDPFRFKNQTEPASVYTNSGHDKRDHFGYGAGRRICPGIHLAERALFLGAARILWAFTIKHKVDGNGKQVPIDLEPATAYRDGFLNQCRPFEVDIKVRSEKRGEAIVAAAKKAEVEIFSAYS
ncbi:cytochrome p450 [Trichoderma arundinaceum]|uniref:Cytochrome p450 n=1 Tax=Trichoderma arundinaceum TaxID=490622 RepID=A0A395NR29_TRIAR|nr:cytochrome p450 [Trichoderma arundinaceum]